MHEKKVHKGLLIILHQVLISFVIGGVLILVYSADITQSATYEDTVEAVCGPKVKFFAELCLVAFCFGSNTAYLVVIGDQLQDSKSEQKD